MGNSLHVDGVRHDVVVEVELRGFGRWNLEFEVWSL